MTTLVTCVAAVLCVVAPQAVAAQSVVTRLPVSSLRVMNYFPASAPWGLFWTNYQHDQVASDYAQIASLGANAVRVIVQPTVLGWPSMSATGAGELKDVIDTAGNNGLQVQLTLFDSFTGYTQEASSISWMQTALAPYANDPRIALVELQNEMPLTNTSAVTWAKDMLAQLPTILPGVPRTISVAGDQSLTLMRSLVAAVPANLLDVIDTHLYGSENAIISKLAAAQAVAAGRPVFVGEFGKPTDSSDSSCSQLAQTSFYERIAYDIASVGIWGITPWTFTDFALSAMPARYVGTDQSSYGIRTVDGTWKMAKTAVSSILHYGTAAQALAGFASQGIQAFNFDSDFECDLRSASDNTGKDAWTVFDPADVGSSGAADGQGVSGTSAGFLSRTAGDPKVKVPSLMHVLPVTSLSPLTVTAQTRLVNATGQTRLALAWFSNTAYLGQTESTYAVNSSSAWQTLSITATPPAGTTSVQIHLKSYGNSGTAYFDTVRVG